MGILSYEPFLLGQSSTEIQYDDDDDDDNNIKHCTAPQFR